MALFWSYGLHPGLVPELLDRLGTDIGVQIEGGVHGHPDGRHAGAKALRQSIDPTLPGINIEEYAENHP